MTKKSIKVSILCLTYNHQDYIEQCIEGFLMQKTNFAFEIIIHDDASTDKTTQIINEYSKKHPGLFKIITQKTNQYSRGVRNLTLRYLIPEVKGKYIALCEGDDYWTDPSKLQRQADFLDKNLDYALCFHPVRVFFENGEKADYIFPPTPEEFTLHKLLQENYIQTNSVMYRAQTPANLPTGVMPLDYYLHLYYAKFGKIGFLNRTMAAYRKHAGGVWWNSHFNKKNLWKEHGSEMVNLRLAVLKLYINEPVYVKLAEKELIDALIKIGFPGDSYKPSDLQDSLRNYNIDPYYFISIILSNLSKEREFFEKKISDLNKSIVRRNDVINKLELRHKVRGRGKKHQLLRKIRTITRSST